jgi:hypothetical protein
LLQPRLAESCSGFREHSQEHLTAELDLADLPPSLLETFTWPCVGPERLACLVHGGIALHSVLSTSLKRM